ncbi:uncharacterized protein CANTADRAFT_34149, partial [Suhomyces tanzawaensis NRRL Y-17324]
KRQRRSYSCGSCKVLKIKCDLQIPCSSCVKFKRMDKCLESPPRPPSKEEMTRIQERKQRTKKKSRLQEVPEGASDVHTGERLLPANGLVAPVPPNGLVAPVPPNSHSQAPSHLHGPYGPRALQGPPLDVLPNASSLPGMHVTPDALFMHYHHQPLVHPEQTPLQAFPALPMAAPVPTPDSHPSTYWANPFGTDGLGSIDAQSRDDELCMVEMSMLEVGKIRRLLPNSFAIVQKLHQAYLHAEDAHVSQLVDHDTLLHKYHHIYTKIKQTGDHDLSKTFRFTIVEVRVASHFLLMFASGLLLEDAGLSNFLLEGLIFQPNAQIIDEWVQLAKALRAKILRYEKTTDILYLLDWYFFAKCYYTLNNQIVDHYLEFNSLLNYVVLNSTFVELIEDPERDTPPAQVPIAMSGSLPTTTSIQEYPASIEFKILARYWMQIRIVDIEHAFFQYKGSLFSSSQLKGTILPHRKVLRFLYGDELEDVADAKLQYDLKLWGLYYRRDVHTVSRTHIIRRYLYLYADVVQLLHEELAELQQRYYSTQASPTADEVARFTLDRRAVDLVMMNQYTVNLFVRWLSFIRVEAGYFPLLRFASYYTTMINLFNHFCLVDQLVTGKYAGARDLLEEVMARYPLAVMRPFYNCMVVQAVFLVVFKNFMDAGHRFRMDLDPSYGRVVHQYHRVVARFASSTALAALHRVPHYRLAVGAVTETLRYLQAARPVHGTAAALMDQYQASMEPLHWQLLVDSYFGSLEMLVGYAEKVWELFEYLRDPAEDGLDNRGPIAITPTVNFDQDMIDNPNSRLSGYVFDTEIVEQYIAHIV